MADLGCHLSIQYQALYSSPPRLVTGTGLGPRLAGIHSLITIKIYPLAPGPWLPEVRWFISGCTHWWYVGFSVLCIKSLLIFSCWLFIYLKWTMSIFYYHMHYDSCFYTSYNLSVLLVFYLVHLWSHPLWLTLILTIVLCVFIYSCIPLFIYLFLGLIFF